MYIAHIPCTYMYVAIKVEKIFSIHFFVLQLLENDRQQEFQLLLDSCNSYMEGLLSDMSPENSLYLWSFLNVLFTYQSSERLHVHIDLVWLYML